MVMEKRRQELKSVGFDEFVIAAIRTRWIQALCLKLDADKLYLKEHKKFLWRCCVALSYRCTVCDNASSQQHFVRRSVKSLRMIRNAAGCLGKDGGVARRFFGFSALSK